MFTQFIARRGSSVLPVSFGRKAALFSKHLFRLVAAVFTLPLIVILVLSGSARAQGLPGEEIGRSAPTNELKVGKLLYQYNCGSCHGESLKGDGPVAAVLKTPPSNLTLLAKHNGGKYPRAEVYEYVVGTKSVVAHGTRKMPVWNPDLYVAPAAPYGLSEGPLTRAERFQRVNEIVDYIATKQIK